jgi:hypothetical protein
VNKLQKLDLFYRHPADESQNVCTLKQVHESASIEDHKLLLLAIHLPQNLNIQYVLLYNTNSTRLQNIRTQSPILSVHVTEFAIVYINTLALNNG